MLRTLKSIPLIINLGQIPQQILKVLPLDPFGVDLVKGERL